MSTGIQKGGFQGKICMKFKKVKTMKKVARDKLIGKKDPFEPGPNHNNSGHKNRLTRQRS